MKTKEIREKINALLIERTEENGKSWGKDAGKHSARALACGLEAQELAKQVGCEAELNQLGAFGLLPIHHDDN